MDLITGLPESNGHDAILTIVDHGCSRAAIFLPCSTTITGASIAQLYLEHLFRWFGIPQKIISDRDPRFTSHFARELTKGLGIDQNLSTAFHPQTDGLSEQANQWVEQYLRLITANQSEWSRWLPMATAVHNNSKNSTTGFAPNELLIRWEPPLATGQRSESKNQTAEEYLSKMRQNRLMAIHALNKVAHKVNISPNRWTTGQLVWLEGKNLPLAHGTAKLAPRQHGPFKVIQIVSPVAVRLELPSQWNIHPVFHNSLLTPYTETPSHGPNFTRPPPDLIDGKEEYEVEQIRSHRTWGRSKSLQYLIKWKGYPESDNTWENADQIHAPELIKLYHQALTRHGLKAQRIRLEKKHTLTIPPLRLHVAHSCSLTNNSSSVANTAYSSLPNLAGPTIIETPADTNRDTTVSFAPDPFRTEIVSKHTSSISTLPIPRRANDWTERPRLLPQPRTSGCTPATFPSFTAEAANTLPLCSANSTSTVSSANSHVSIGAPSARKRSLPIALSKTTYLTNTSSIRPSYIGSSKWSGPLKPHLARAHLNRVLVVPRNPVSTSSQANLSGTSSSDSPTRCCPIMPTSINAFASSTTVHSIIRANDSAATTCNVRGRPFLREG
jgi:Chromo (CHRromatin Organisation MOdifier) domain